MLKTLKRTQAAPEGDHLDQAVFFLFGRQLVELSKKVNADDLVVEAELVAEAARQLREESDADRQRAIIGAMDTETALALCRWIIDPGCMAQFIAKGVH